MHSGPRGSKTSLEQLFQQLDCYTLYEKVINAIDHLTNEEVKRLIVENQTRSQDAQEPQVQRLMCYNFLTLLYLKLSRIQDATRAKDQCLSKDRDNILALMNNFRLCQKLREVNKAKQHLEQIEKLCQAETSKNSGLHPGLQLKGELAFCFSTLDGCCLGQALKLYPELLSVLWAWNGSVSEGNTYCSSSEPPLPELLQNGTTRDRYVCWAFELADIYCRLSQSSNLQCYGTQEQIRTFDPASHVDDICNILSFVTHFGSDLYKARSYLLLVETFQNCEVKRSILGGRVKLRFNTHLLVDRAYHLASGDSWVLARCGRYYRQRACSFRAVQHALDVLNEALEACSSNHVALHEKALCLRMLWVLARKYREQKLIINDERSKGKKRNGSSVFSETDDVQESSRNICAWCIIQHGYESDHSQESEESSSSPTSSGMPCDTQETGNVHGCSNLSGATNFCTSMADTGITNSSDVKPRILQTDSMNPGKKTFASCRSQSCPHGWPGCVAQCGPGDKNFLRRHSSSQATIQPRNPVTPGKPAEHFCQPGYFDVLRTNNPKDCDEPHDFLQQAVAAAEQAVEVSGSTILRYLVDLARLYISCGETDKAEAVFAEAQSMRSNSDDAAYLFEQWGLLKQGYLGNDASSLDDIKDLFRQAVVSAVHGNQRSRVAFYKLRDIIEAEMKMESNRLCLLKEKTLLYKCIMDYSRAERSILQALREFPGDQILIWEMLDLFDKTNNVRAARRYINLFMETTTDWLRCQKAFDTYGDDSSAFCGRNLLDLMLRAAGGDECLASQTNLRRQIFQWMLPSDFDGADIVCDVLIVAEEVGHELVQYLTAILTNQCGLEVFVVTATGNDDLYRFPGWSSGTMLDGMDKMCAHLNKIRSVVFIPPLERNGGMMSVMVGMILQERDFQAEGAGILSVCSSGEAVSDPALGCFPQTVISGSDSVSTSQVIHDVFCKLLLGTEVDC